jgi:predicted glycoside hydrolase/deacetylase ChbG (UPF0249 family)
MRAFEYVVRAQLDEFARIYGAPARRIDGHHHMHLCANVVMAGLMPAGTVVRRNFSFQPGEKSAANRMYRHAVDGLLCRRHAMADYFFALPPLEPRDRLRRLFSLAGHCVVEFEAHPVLPEEFRFLTGGDLQRCAGDLAVARRFEMPTCGVVPVRARASR